MSWRITLASTRIASKNSDGNKYRRVVMRPFAQGNNQSQKAPGVTDTIAAGLTEVLMRPWLMVLPILLDLYYWIGWRLLPSALTARIARVASDELMFDKRSNMNWLRDVGKLDLSGMLGLTVP